MLLPYKHIKYLCKQRVVLGYLYIIERNRCIHLRVSVSTDLTISFYTVYYLETVKIKRLLNTIFLILISFSISKTFNYTSYKSNTSFSPSFTFMFQRFLFSFIDKTDLVLFFMNVYV